jgi:DDE_Tnp_1-associated
MRQASSLAAGLFESPGGRIKKGQPCYNGKNSKRSQKAREPSWTLLHLPPQSELPPNLEEVDAHSMYAAFEKITDGRCKRGIRYSVTLILTLILLAKLAGEPKLSGVAHWARLRGTWLNEVLHLQRTSWLFASCLSSFDFRKALGDVADSLAAVTSSIV